MSYEISKDFPNFRIMNTSPDFRINWFSRKEIENLNMDPVWKSKLLEVFQARSEMDEALRRFSETVEWS